MYLLSEIKLSNGDEVGAYCHLLTGYLSTDCSPQNTLKNIQLYVNVSFYSSITAVKRLLFSGRN